MNDKDNENTPITNSHLYNVALFIDYENVYLNLLKENRNVIRDGFFEKIREWCKKNHRRLVTISAAVLWRGIHSHFQPGQKLCRSANYHRCFKRHASES